MIMTTSDSGSGRGRGASSGSGGGGAATTPNNNNNNSNGGTSHSALVNIVLLVVFVVVVVAVGLVFLRWLLRHLRRSRGRGAWPLFLRSEPKPKLFEVSLSTRGKGLDGSTGWASLKVSPLVIRCPETVELV